MASGIPTNRTNITLPTEVSEVIMQKTQESSAIMSLAKRINLTGKGASIPVIVSDPVASWVAETDKKPVSNPELTTKIMTPYKLAVIVPFSDEFARDAEALYDEIVRRVPLALAEKFDKTVFTGSGAPVANFDTFASATAQSLSSGAYDALVGAVTDVADAGYALNGWVLSPQAKGELLLAKDSDQRPIFLNNVSEDAFPTILGERVHISRAAYAQGTPDLVGVAGDWSQALYGTVEGVKIDYSKEASLTIDNEVVNLWERNMFALRAEIEVGFRADVNAFNKLTRTGTSS